jgi:pyridoxal phosphate enzyme (YggS family)
MNIKNNISIFTKEMLPGCKLVAVSKTKPNEMIMEAYNAGQRLFGENRVQELVAKYDALPKDIEWHMIGHLQSNKVKMMAQFVHLIHSVDSLGLLEEINKQALKAGRVIPCLLQIYVAKEETKFGFSEEEVLDAFKNKAFDKFNNVEIKGLMGMATFTENKDQVRSEFKSLRTLFEKLKSSSLPGNASMRELSMGMSGDYKIAMEEGSTMVRLGSSIFGGR